MRLAQGAHITNRLVLLEFPRLEDVPRQRQLHGPPRQRARLRKQASKIAVTEAGRTEGTAPTAPAPRQLGLKDNPDDEESEIRPQARGRPEGERPQWKIGDAGLAECGAPPGHGVNDGSRVKLRDVSRELLEHGYQMTDRHLAKWVRSRMPSARRSAMTSSPGRRTRPPAIPGRSRLSSRRRQPQPADRAPLKRATPVSSIYGLARGPVAGLVGIEGGVVSGVINLESPGV
jgi:hypothetical protein